MSDEPVMQAEGMDTETKLETDQILDDTPETRCQSPDSSACGKREEKDADTTQKTCKGGGSVDPDTVQKVDQTDEDKSSKSDAVEKANKTEEEKGGNSNEKDKVGGNTTETLNEIKESEIVSKNLTPKTDKESEDENVEDTINRIEKLEDSGNEGKGNSSVKSDNKEVPMDFSSKGDEHGQNFEVIDGQYFYTDSKTSRRYRYERKINEWVDVTAELEDSGSEVNGNSTQKSNDKEEPMDFSSKGDEHEHNFEFIDGQYFYTDSKTSRRYRYEKKLNEWVDVMAEVLNKDDAHPTDESKKSEKQTSESNANHKPEAEHTTTTDSEGRTYYYADNYYLCQDRDGNVFFLDEKNEWKPWAEKDNVKSSESSKWYFCQGDSTFYRDNASGVVYRLNKDTNAWEKYDGKLRKKRPMVDDEEFDTDEYDSEEETGGGLMPPGAKEDPNISYDGTTYTKVDPTDKMMYEWDTERRAWFPKLDEDFMATYQLSYGFNPDGTKNENPLKFDDESEEEEEKKAAEALRLKQEKEKAKGTKKASWFEMDENRNTKVYVSNLPDNMTENMFITLMQKCGMIMLDDAKAKPKIKLYRDEEGNFKGDALCTYIKVESVELAEQILDGYQVGNKQIRVEPAKFEQKGNYNPKLKPRKKGKKELEKLKKKQEKLFDWRPEPLRGERKKYENTVVIRNVFDPKEFEVAMDKIIDHKEAMRSQASNFGKIKKLELFDLHPEGVVQVTFEEVESADMCVATLHKRLYAGRTLYVTTWDGKEKFKIEETAAEREERIKKWNEFLESESTSNK